MKKILFVGDINVDIIMGGLECLPVPDREIRCRSFEMTLGSSAVIAACAYAALGGSAAVAGLAGDDDFGRFMLRGLEEFGIDASLVEVAADVPTGVTVNLIQGGERSQVTYPGTIEQFEGRRLTRDVLARFDHLHFAGPYQQTRLRPRIQPLLETARSLGRTTSMDPQWDSTGQWEGLQDWLPLLTFFFPNRGEALALSRTGSVAEALQWCLERNTCPVVKAGAEGAYLPDPSGRIEQVPGWAVPVVDTTGAGDVFDAAFLYWVLEKNAAPQQACRFANAAAARSCAFQGGVAARSSYDDVVKAASGDFGEIAGA